MPSFRLGIITITPRLEHRLAKVREFLCHIHHQCISLGKTNIITCLRECKSEYTGVNVCKCEWQIDGLVDRV